MNKTQINNLDEIVRQGGAVIASHWTSGSGRYITKRVIPPLCVELQLDKYDDRQRVNELKGIVKKSVKKLLKDYPRARKIIICSDIRKANKAIRSISND